MQKIGQYSIIRELGSGQFGTVYLGIGDVPSRSFGSRRRRVVALKRLRDSTDRRSAQLLMQEFALLEQVKHRCIMRVFEYLHAENTLVMEYVHGVTLRHILDDLGTHKNRFPSNAAIDFGIEISDALFQAYTSSGENSEPLKLVHRDLKPANIMLTTNGELKILDFGLAQISNSEFGHLRDDDIQGTPIYMAPEQAQGLNLDHRTDLFSLGLILVELLTGQPAYPIPINSRDPIRQIMKDISAGRFSFTLEELHRRLPSIGPVLTNILQLDADRRYRDGRELQFALRARSSAGNQQSLVKFAQFYYTAIRPMGPPPVLEELEAELSGLSSSNLSLSEAFRQVRRSGNSFGASQVSKPAHSQHSVPTPLTSRSSVSGGPTMTKRNPPKRPNVVPPTSSSATTPAPRMSSRQIIPERIDSSAPDAPLGDDATTFIAIKPNVASTPPVSGGFNSPPQASRGAPLPPPPSPPGFQARANQPSVSYPPQQPAHHSIPNAGGIGSGRIGSGGIGTGRVGSGGIGTGLPAGGHHNPGQSSYHQSLDQPSGAIHQTELSGDTGSTRVYALLFAAFALVCICFIAVVWLKQPEEKKPEIVETVSTPPPIIEPTDDPIDEPAVVAKVPETKPVKTVRKPPKTPPKPRTSNLTIKISSSSSTVTSVNLTCAGYNKQKSGKSMTFTSVPSGDCKLKFNPTGLSYRGSFAGKTLTCTVSSTAKCK